MHTYSEDNSGNINTKLSMDTVPSLCVLHNWVKQRIVLNR